MSSNTHPKKTHNTDSHARDSRNRVSCAKEIQDRESHARNFHNTESHNQKTHDKKFYNAIEYNVTQDSMPIKKEAYSPYTQDYMAQDSIKNAIQTDKKYPHSSHNIQHGSLANNTESTQNAHYHEILLHVACRESSLQDIITQSIADIIAEYNDGVEFLDSAMIHYKECK